MIEFTAFITSVSALAKIAKGLKSLNDEYQISQATSELLEKVLSIQGDALSLQEQHFSLIREKENIEKKLLEFENWENTESQYNLKRLVGGKIVYAPNESHKPAEPMHWLCPNCFNDRKKSILQPNVDRNTFTLSCFRCKTTLLISSDDLQSYMAS